MKPGKPIKPKQISQKKEAAPKPLFPMRINKYLAWKQYCTRREGDEYVKQGRVFLNGRRAVLGDKVQETDTVEVRFRVKSYRYYAYNKPRGIITHSPDEGEEDIRQVVPLEGVFPVGRLDKDSHGLMILTDDGRITNKLLNPEYAHEKEYVVQTNESLTPSFENKMERGVNIEGYVTKPCEVTVLSNHKFSIVLTEGKKHQIRRMCAALGYTVADLQRRRVMNISLGNIQEGQYRPIEGKVLSDFLKQLGF